MSHAVTRKAVQPRIGLVLGGGGARGLGHILMLEAFEELGIRPAAIVGTSIGAIYGSLVAAGLPAKLIRAHTEEILSQRFDLMRQLFQARAEPVQRLLSVLQLKSALLNAETLLDLLLPPRVPRTFEELSIPLRVVATDFYAHEAVAIGEGPLRSAVAASMALPALFAPVVRGDRVLMDGGLVNPLPFDVPGPEVDVTVAIDVSGMPRLMDGSAGPSALEALVASSQIMQRAIVAEKLKSRRPDVYIDVDVDRFHVLEFHRYKDILAAAAPAKERLRRQLQRLTGSETVATEVLTAEAPAIAISPPKQ
jgi:NTE family protein